MVERACHGQYTSASFFEWSGGCVEDVISCRAGGGDLRTLASFNFGESGSTDRVYLNDAGVLSLKAFFTNGTSGVITMQLPEPATPLALVTFVLLIARRRG